MPDDVIDHLERETRLGASVRQAILDQVAPWIDRPPQNILDLGSGVGADTVALAERFPVARIHALDVTPTLLDRVASTALAAGVGDRVTTQVVDLNHEWAGDVPQNIDVAWASLSLHHLSDPARALERVFASLRQSGVLVLSELAGEVRLAPDDLGTGLDGLAGRLAPALSAPSEFSGIDWSTLLEEAGFESVDRREHEFTVRADTSDGAAYLEARLRARRDRVADELSDDELAAFDVLTQAVAAGDSAISFSSTRTVWLAVRAASDGGEAVGSR